ncbi:MAG: ATP-binding protein [Spirochaetales bacterium]|nr:ATP-binding protein [Spirochaetales bacterium]
MDRTIRLGYSHGSGVISGIFYRLLPVQILLMVLSSINTIIDGLFASNCISLVAMDATGLFAPVNGVISAIGAVMLGGSQILCGNFMGKNQDEATNGVFSLDMVVITVLGAILTLTCLFFSSPLALLLGAKGAVADELALYIWGISFGFVPMMISTQLSAFLQMENEQKRTYIGIAAMMVSNTLFDWLFIVQMDLGMLGLGLASSLSNLVFVFVLLSRYFSGKTSMHFSLKLIAWKQLGKVIYIGLPGAITTFCLSVKWTLYNYLLTNYGGDGALGAYAAFSSLGAFFFAITAGIGTTTRLLASVYVSERDRTSLIETMKVALIQGGLMVTAFSVLIILCAVPLTRIYYRDAALPVYGLTISLLRINAISIPLSEISYVIQSYYQCRGRMKIVNAIAIADGLVASGLMALVLTPPFGAVGLWWSIVANGVICLGIVIVYSMIVMKRFPRSFTDFIGLEEEFGVPESDRLDMVAFGMDEVMNLSETVITFCTQKGLDPKRAYYAGLCLEEMAGNIVLHGFNKDNKKHAVDMRVVYEEDQLTIRLSDNCRAFNPKERAEIFNPDDITKNIGVRMVARIAKSMQYQHMLGLNVLTMVI